MEFENDGNGSATKCVFTSALPQKCISGKKISSPQTDLGGGDLRFWNAFPVKVFESPRGLNPQNFQPAAGFYSAFARFAGAFSIS